MSVYFLIPNIMNNPHLKNDLFSAIVEEYKEYAERNDTLERFIYDVDTLGGTLHFDFFEGWHETNKTHATIMDKSFKIIDRYSLKDIWNAVKGDQLCLF